MALGTEGQYSERVFSDAEGFQNLKELLRRRQFLWDLDWL